MSGAPDAPPTPLVLESEALGGKMVSASLSCVALAKSLCLSESQLPLL